MLHSIFTILINIICTVLAETLLLRFWVQVMHIHPPILINQFIFQISNWIVKPVHQILSSKINYSLASLFSALLIALLFAIIEIQFLSQFSLKSIILLTMMHFFQWIFYGFITTLTAETIFHWIHPYAPLTLFFQALNEPLLGFLRKFIPFIHNIDLSPLIALILLQISVHMIHSLFILLV